LTLRSFGVIGIDATPAFAKIAARFHAILMLP